MNSRTSSERSSGAGSFAASLLSAAGFLLLAAAAHGEGLTGSWAGTATQGGTKYPVEMTLKDASGTISYPSFQCGGTLTLLRSDAKTHLYREHLTRGQVKCIDGGAVQVSVLGSGGKNSIEWRWEGSGASASGVLRSSEADAREAGPKTASSSTALAPESTPQLSTSGIGEAKFGMTLAATEQALASKLDFAKGISANQMNTGLCVPANTAGLPGVQLFFTKGRLDGVSSDKPSVMTKSGLKVGDSEAAVIKRFQSDPTYKRTESRHEGAALMEITLGKSGTAHDTSLMFQSRRGIVTSIRAGHVGFVYDPDYCAQ